MHIVITGGAGFLGAALARKILAAETLRPAGRAATAVDRVTILDRAAPPSDLALDNRVRSVVGDISDLLSGPQSRDILDQAEVVFHLAAAVSGECEADIDVGMNANVIGSMAVLDGCRREGNAPTLVFASSLAVFGGWPGQALPPVVTDTTLPTPRTSYGVQKFVIEQLVADYTRKGFVDGRSVRLITVCVRPGRANAAASGFLSTIIREPLAGQRAVCPVGGDTMVAVSSPERTLEGLLRAAETTTTDWGAPTAINLPAMQLSVDHMIEALARVAGPAAPDLIDWVPDPEIAAIVAGWPSAVDAPRARSLGLQPDDDFEMVIRRYARDFVNPTTHATT
jgi:D-erythronate 2-dehydrogenase